MLDGAGSAHWWYASGSGTAGWLHFAVALVWMVVEVTSKIRAKKLGCSLVSDTLTVLLVKTTDVTDADPSLRLSTAYPDAVALAAPTTPPSQAARLVSDESKQRWASADSCRVRGILQLGACAPRPHRCR